MLNICVPPLNSEKGRSREERLTTGKTSRDSTSVFCLGHAARSSGTHFHALASPLCIPVYLPLTYDLGSRVSAVYTPDSLAQNGRDPLGASHDRGTISTFRGQTIA